MQRLSNGLRWANVLLILLTFFAYLSPYVSPAVFWPLAVVALLYPWLLIAHLLFIVTWVLLRRFYFVFSLGCILLGFNHLTSLVGLNFGSRPATGGTEITVMSYNIHKLKDEHQGDRYIEGLELQNQIQKENIDLLLVQEYPGRHLDVSHAFADGLKEKTRLQYHYREKRGGLSLFSAYPIRNIEKVSSNSVNGYLYADLELPRETLRIYNLHLSSNRISTIADRLAANGKLQEKRTWLDIKGMIASFKWTAKLRAEEAEEIAAHLAESPYPVLLCGDFNDIPQSYTYYVLTRHLRDAFQEAGLGLGTTYAGKIPGLRIDYILVDPRIQVNSYQVGHQTSSDHYPVWSRIVLPEG